MRSKLAAIAITGFAISAVCLGGAFALGGDAVGSSILDLGNFGQPRCDVAGSSGGASRSLPWNGIGDRVAIDFAADTTYRAGSGDQLVVRGDPAVISHVFVRDGVVGIDCRRNGSFFRDTPRIEVTLPGRAFRTFEQRSSGDMRLTAALSQPDARLSRSKAPAIFRPTARSSACRFGWPRFGQPIRPPAAPVHSMWICKALVTSVWAALLPKARMSRSMAAVMSKSHPRMHRVSILPVPARAISRRRVRPTA